MAKEYSSPPLGRIPLHLSLNRGIDTGHLLLHTISDAPEAIAFRRLAVEVSRKMGLRPGGEEGCR
jgi:hypothetical protein